MYVCICNALFNIIANSTVELKGNANSEFTIFIQSTAQFVIKRKRYLYLNVYMYMIELVNKTMNIKHLQKLGSVFFGTN